jgi:hypothetical protein
MALVGGGLGRRVGDGRLRENQDKHVDPAREAGGPITVPLVKDKHFAGRRDRLVRSRAAQA